MTPFRTPCYLFFFLICFLSAGCANQPKNKQKLSTPQSEILSIAQLKTELSQELNHAFQQGEFAGTIHITSKQGDLFSTSFGYADKKNRVLNTQNTISDIGSVAKTFTAAAVLKLVAESKLDLGTTLGQIFTSAPQDKQAITIEQLLAHQSGLDNYHADSDFEPMTKQQALTKIFSMPLIAKPNETIAYSNAAYALLAAIVEEVAQQNFRTHINQEILKPLSLEHTGFYGDSHLEQALLAKGYGGDRSGKTTFNQPLTWALLGGGGMVSSATDLKAWHQALTKGNFVTIDKQNLAFKTINEKWKLGNIRRVGSWGTPIHYIGGSTDFGYTAAIFELTDLDVSIYLLLNKYHEDYEASSHQKLAKHHIMPILLRAQRLLESQKAL